MMDTVTKVFNMLTQNNCPSFVSYIQPFPIKLNLANINMTDKFFYLKSNSDKIRFLAPIKEVIFFL